MRRKPSRVLQIINASVVVERVSMWDSRTWDFVTKYVATAAGVRLRTKSGMYFSTRERAKAAGLRACCGSERRSAYAKVKREGSGTASRQRGHGRFKR